MLLQMTRPVQAGIRQEKHYEVISNHLANANTTGFKKDVLSFDRVFKAQMNVDHSQGSLRVTGNTLDVGLREPGFFKIETQQGIRYTRDGNFMLNMNGNLVTQTGDLVIGDNGPIPIDGNNVHITREGDVEVDGIIAGRIAVVDFDSREKLERAGNNYFEYTGDERDEVPAELLSVQQGSLEMSNVSTVNEMTGLIEANRMYETIQKVIHTYDELDSKVINDVGRSA